MIVICDWLWQAGLKRYMTVLGGKVCKKHRVMMGVASAALCSHLTRFLGAGSLWCLERKRERSSIFSALRGAMGWLGELCTTASNSEKVALSCCHLKLFAWFRTVSTRMDGLAELCL